MAAALAFLVEPLVAKSLLPAYGGTSAVWTTALVFFQSTLLAGYAWAHVTLRVLGLRRHAMVQVVVVVVALAGLVLNRLAVPAFAAAPTGFPEFGWLLVVLGAIVGLPFVVLATASPTTQRWFAAMPGSREPYRLFAASNAGSLLGLVAYPTLVEPNLDLAQQAAWWSLGFAAFALATIGVAVLVVRATRSGQIVEFTDERLDQADPTGDGRPTRARRARWVLLAAVPAALLVAVTTRLSTDVAAVPLLWIAPLVVYLATMILAYLRAAPIGLRLATIAFPPLAFLVALQGLGLMEVGIWPVIGLHLAALTAAGLALHGRLAADRPSPAWLTEYSLHVALGGAAGGIVTGIVAPILLTVPVEAFLVLIVAALLVGGSRWHQLTVVPAVAALAVALTVALSGDPGTIRTARTFYGYYRVVEPRPGLHVLYSGTTIHGRQDLAADRAGEPLSYYHRGGPLGEVIASLQAERPALRIGAVGLGAGAVAAYGRGADSIWFVEIDPAVVSIARDPAAFTYLADSPAAIEVVIGDGRLELDRVAPASFDLLVLDAFSSDAVPVHLLTVEALQIQMARVALRGVIAIHVSNRFLDLEPVVASAARALGLVSIIGSDQPVADLVGLADASQWVLVGRSYSDLAGLVEGSEWQTAHARDARAWTDRWSDMLGALRE